MIAGDWAGEVAIAGLRLTLGVTMAIHGYRKFAGPGGIAGTAAWFDSIGMRPGPVNARLAATTEVAAGVAIAVGLLTPVAAAAVISLMLVAAWVAHRGKGFLIVGDGWEYNLFIAVTAAAIAGLGAGPLSLDRLLFADTAWAGLLAGGPALAGAIAVGLAAGAAALLACYRPPTPARTDRQEATR